MNWDFPHDPTGRVIPQLWERTAAEYRRREREEAVRDLATRGYCYLWTPAAGLRTVTAPVRPGGYDVDAGLREWDALVSMRVRPRAG